MFYVYKDFPVIQLHPQAEYAAEAAECSGDQGKYWPMHDRLFAQQTTWDTTPSAANAAFSVYVQQLGLDRVQFERCLTTHQHATKVKQDISEGGHLGTTATPTFVINGKQLVGALPTQSFLNAIQNELKP